MRSFFTLILCTLLILNTLSCTKFSSDDYTAKMAGTRTFEGSTRFCSYPGIGKIFDAFKIEKIDKSTIKGCFGGTLKYSYTDKTAHTFNFEESQNENKLARHEVLSYNYETQSISAGFTVESYGCKEQATINTIQYPQNFLLHDYTHKMAKTVLLSGPCRDFSTLRVPQDSSYNINENVAFVLVNDSTLRYIPNFLHAEDNLVHYKSVNESAKTIVFQSYYQTSQKQAFTTLTYNYGNNTYIFEQEYTTIYESKSLKLQ
jgi:hypothetical protein